MIISASYKTDIPAFYGQWFINRLNSGYCKTVNPYGKQVYRIDLNRESVDGFIFWTKNIGPFLNYLKEVNRREFPFLVQYTINNYPNALEFSVVNSTKSVEYFKRISNEYGPKVPVWRYDTIILSSLTPLDFHKRNFEQLATALRGVTDEVVVSFAQIYKKTLKNMNWASEKYSFTWEDPEYAVKIQLLETLSHIAYANDMKLTICSQPELKINSAGEAHCIDINRLSLVANRPIVAKLKGNRPGCACYYSRDIGEYDTCPHGCVYCYAVQNRDLARERFKKHNPEGEFLFEPSGVIPDFDDDETKPIQGTLF